MFRRRVLLLFFFTLVFAPLLSFASGSSSNPGSYETELVERAEALKLYDDPYWHILLQYRPRWFSGVKSEIKARGFFNSKNGGTDPRSELAETIRRFFERSSQDPEAQHPQCLFIDRYTWLKKKLGFDAGKLPEHPCADFEVWRKALDPESVTLVFSSYYMSNPSSTFGHTLLRLNHRRRSEGEKLLDYGVNYAANPTTKNALFYGFLGMLGGFDGVFSNVPYFMKVEEYNDVESRELWEYDLKFTQAQVDQLLLHLWTVGHFSTPYYFFDKNCSFMILALLDAGNPELKLSEQMNRAWWVIPSDTVRAVASRPGFVTKVEVRPSLAYRIRSQRSRLTSEQDELFLAVIHDPASKDRLDEVRRGPNPARILDLISDYLRYLKTKNKNVLPADDQMLLKEVLNERSELPDKTPEISLSQDQIKEARPDSGHDTARVSVGGGYNSLTQGFMEIGVRPAFHDLNASPVGYPKDAQIELLDVDARYSPDPKLLRFEKINIVSILSVNPWDRVFRKFSWSARLGADPVRDFNCQDCLEYKGQLGGGVSSSLSQDFLVFALAKAELGFGAQYQPGYRLGPGAELGALISLSDSFSVLFGGHYSHPLLGYTSSFLGGSVEARASVSRNTEIRMNYEAYEISHEGKIGLDVYF
jgi:hypothetical protein